MKHNPNHLYMLLQGTPYIGTDKQTHWVFSNTSRRWKQSHDDWDAVFPTSTNWWRWFEDLPELPVGGPRIEKFLSSAALSKMVVPLTIAMQIVMKQTRHGSPQSQNAKIRALGYQRRRITVELMSCRFFANGRMMLGAIRRALSH